MENKEITIEKKGLVKNLQRLPSFYSMIIIMYISVELEQYFVHI